MKDKECKVDGCNRENYAKGYCSKHYQIIIRCGKLKDKVFENTKECMVDGCVRLRNSKGYCKYHYSQVSKYGKIVRIEPINRGNANKECIVDGCSKFRHVGKYCTKHYSQIKTYGELRPNNEKGKTFNAALLKTEVIDYNDIDIISIYEEILSGNRSRFPKGIWMRPDAIMNAKKVIRYIILNKMKIKPDDIKAIKALTIEDFVKYKCRGAFTIQGIMNKKLVIESCFPELDFTVLDFCSVNGCNTHTFSMGYCQRHYAQLQLHGRIRDDSEFIRITDCIVDNCNGKHAASGYCARHYAQFRRYDRITKE